MTKSEVFVAIFMKTLGIEEKNGRWLGGPCAKVPDIGRKHPGPAERFARSQCICRDRAVLENRSFDPETRELRSHIQEIIAGGKIILKERVKPET